MATGAREDEAIPCAERSGVRFATRRFPSATGNRGTVKALEFRFFCCGRLQHQCGVAAGRDAIGKYRFARRHTERIATAFVLSHEIAHVLQVHYWREVHETRGQRVGLTIAGLAAERSSATSELSCLGWVSRPL